MIDALARRAFIYPREYELLIADVQPDCVERPEGFDDSLGALAEEHGLQLLQRRPAAPDPGAPWASRCQGCRAARFEQVVDLAREVDATVVATARALDGTVERDLITMMGEGRALKRSPCFVEADSGLRIVAPLFDIEERQVRRHVREGGDLDAAATCPYAPLGSGESKAWLGSLGGRVIRKTHAIQRALSRL